MSVKKSIFALFVGLIVVLMATSTASARPLADTVGTGFTYQGHLMDGGNPANGSYDFQFSLYNSASSGAQVGSTLTQTGVTVSNGLFTVQLDFGSVFDGTALYLQVAVRPGGSSGSYTPLTPLQPLSATPYAQYALAAGNATTVTNGLYSTGSYSNPAWITALDGGKITGSVASVTNGLYSTGSYSNPAWLTGLDGGKITGTVSNSDKVDGQDASAFASASHTHWGQTWSGSGNGLTLTSSGGGSGSIGLNATGDYAAIMGQSPTTGYIGVYGYGPDGIFAQSNKSDGNAIYAQAYSATSSAGYFVGNVSVTGNLTVSGSKSAVVDTQDYGTRTLYAVESPQNWFEDFGTGQLENGVAVIAIDPVFAETVNLSVDYHVFLTPDGDCQLYVDQKTPSSFTVRAIGGQTCSIPFDYRIDAKRLGYEDVRLAPVAPKATPDAPTK